MAAAYSQSERRWRHQHFGRHRIGRIRRRWRPGYKRATEGCRGYRGGPRRQCLLRRRQQPAHPQSRRRRNHHHDCRQYARILRRWRPVDRRPPSRSSRCCPRCRGQHYFHRHRKLQGPQIAQSSANSISAAPSTLLFAYTVGGATPPAQTMNVSSSGAPLSFSAAVSTGGNWLAVSPSSGTTPATLTVSVTPFGLPGGVYQGAITVTPAGACPAQDVFFCLADCDGGWRAIFHCHQRIERCRVSEQAGALYSLRHLREQHGTVQYRDRNRSQLPTLSRGHFDYIYSVLRWNAHQRETGVLGRRSDRGIASFLDRPRNLRRAGHLQHAHQRAAERHRRSPHPLQPRDIYQRGKQLGKLTATDRKCEWRHQPHPLHCWPNRVQRTQLDAHTHAPWRHRRPMGNRWRRRSSERHWRLVRRPDCGREFHRERRRQTHHTPLRRCLLRLPRPVAGQLHPAGGCHARLFCLPFK